MQVNLLKFQRVAVRKTPTPPSALNTNVQWGSLTGTSHTFTLSFLLFMKGFLFHPFLEAVAGITLRHFCRRKDKNSCLT